MSARTPISAAHPRVLHLIDTGGPGGAETVFSDIVSHCNRLNLNAAVSVPYDGWLANRLRQNGTQPEIIQSKNANFASLIYQLMKLTRLSNANLIHAHLLGSGVYGSLVSSLRSMPVVVTFHGATDLAGRGSLYSAKRWLLNRRHTHPVAVSEPVRDALVSWGIRKASIRIIRNGVDTSIFRPDTDASLHAELGLPDTNRIVGAIGNIRPAKSYDVFIRAAGLLATRFEDLHFVIAGSGNAADIANLSELARQQHLGSRFHLLGFRSTSSGLVRSLDVLVSSSTTEGLPLSLLEGMACAVPIAATSNEGAVRLLTETKAGLLSPVGDPHALAESISTLLTDKELSVSLGQYGRSSVARDFGLSKTLDSYCALYDELLSRKPV